MDMRGDSDAVRVLEDDLHLAAQRAQRASREPLDLAARELDAPWLRMQPQQRQAERRLARAALADHAQVCPSRTVTLTPSTALTWPDRAAEQAAP